MDEHTDKFGYHALEHRGCPAIGRGPAAMRPGADGVGACAACGYRSDTPPTGTLADCFDLVHRQWGLRADPHVWGLMRDRLSHEPTPPDVEAVLVAAFEAETGLDLGAEGERRVYVEQHDHGGMSGGFVDLDWWRTKGIPLMVARATRTRS